jgi:hypothetical protein
VIENLQNHFIFFLTEEMWRQGCTKIKHSFFLHILKILFLFFSFLAKFSDSKFSHKKEGERKIKKKKKKKRGANHRLCNKKQTLKTSPILKLPINPCF